MNHTHLYCKTLSRVTKAELINALHQSLLQLSAMGERVEVDGRTFDNNPAITESTRLLKKADYLGYSE